MTREQKYIKKLREICRGLGLKLRIQKEITKGQWLCDGIIRASYLEENLVSNLSHEIGHWIVASEQERSIVDFNMGPSPEIKYVPYLMNQSTESVKFCEYREKEASLIGILIEKTIGADWRSTWKYHGWNCNGYYEEFYDELLRLELQDYISDSVMVKHVNSWDLLFEL